MIGLAFLWLVLMILEMTSGLPVWAETLSLVIWAAFVVEFSIRLFLAAKKGRFLRENWLTALSLLVPALRILRPLRFLRFARGLRSIQVVRVVGSLNRSMGALGQTMGRRGFGYVAILTTLVAFGGAAGMFAFEKAAGHEGFSSYPDALWWTVMILTTSGSGYWPETNEGRVLGFLLALYAFSVFGYVAATLASFFVERDAAAPESDTASSQQLDEILAELRELRKSQEAGTQITLM
jgi:voltage-gated potassium channel